MKIGEDFKKIGTLDKGELVLKFPGTDMKMAYEESEAFLSKSGIGYISLAVRDIYCVEDGEPVGMFGGLGRELSEQLNEPSNREMVRKIIASKNYSLFYSKDTDGLEILCIPGVSGENIVDAESIPGMTVAAYGIGGDVPSAESIYAHHIKAVGKKKLMTNGNELEKEVLNLVSKANTAYEKACQITIDSGI